MGEELRGGQPVRPARVALAPRPTGRAAEACRGCLASPHPGSVGRQRLPSDRRNSLGSWAWTLRKAAMNCE